MSKLEFRHTENDTTELKNEAETESCISSGGQQMATPGCRETCGATEVNEKTPLTPSLCELRPDEIMAQASGLTG